eukprot:767401-Hanusia_phi.AAC.2
MDNRKDGPDSNCLSNDRRTERDNDTTKYSTLTWPRLSTVRHSVTEMPQCCPTIPTHCGIPRGRPGRALAASGGGDRCV